MCGTSVFCRNGGDPGGKAQVCWPSSHVTLCNPATPTVRWDRTGAEARGTLPVEGGRWEPAPGSCPPTCKGVSLCASVHTNSKGNVQIVKGDHSSLEKGAEMLLLVRNCWSLDYGFAMGNSEWISLVLFRLKKRKEKEHANIVGAGSLCRGWGCFWTY